MVNPFKDHPKKNADMTWLQHFISAIGIGIRLIVTGIFFIIHGVFPFVQIPKHFNLGNSVNYLEKENDKRKSIKGKHKKL